MKLFASDYDGTFCKHENRKRDEIKNNVFQSGRWREGGNIFAFATGRSISMMQLEKRRHGIEYDYIVGLNGAVIVDKSDNVLFRMSIKPSIAKEIIALIESKNIGNYSITDGFKGHFRAPLSLKSPSLLLFKLLGLFTRTYHLSKEEALKLPVAQIALTVENPQEAVAFADFINETFKGEAFAFANLVHVDIQAPGLSKATGIEFIAQKYHLSETLIYGMGDSFNDIPMFERFHGLTLPEATKEIKEQAKGVYDTVGHALKDLM